MSDPTPFAEFDFGESGYAVVGAFEGREVVMATFTNRAEAEGFTLGYGWGSAQEMAKLSVIEFRRVPGR